MLKFTKNKQGHSAFTIHENATLREIITDCGVSLPFLPFQQSIDPKLYPIVKARALWDTGATNSCITKGLADKIGLKPFTVVNVHHAVGTTPRNVYKVNIALPNNIAVPMVNVTECESTAGKFDLIIGMDIITVGDFAITNVDKKTMVSFRIPSNVSIDFNDGETIITPGKKQLTEEDKIIVKSYTGVNRNQLCPCNSGKKYKHCHGKTA